MSKATERAREISFGLASRKHNEGLEWLAEYITARDRAVAGKVIEACMQAAQNWEVKQTSMSRGMEPLKTTGIEGYIHKSASEAIRALPLAEGWKKKYETLLAHTEQDYMP